MEVSKKSKENPIINFLSSIKLAITLLIILALTSVVGTLIPQGESLQFYLEKYGPTFFRIIHLLDLNDTYGAWWFISLLLFFCLNLVVCTLKRLPFTLKLYKKDSLQVDVPRLVKMPYHRSWNPKMKKSEAMDDVLLAFQGVAGKYVARNGVDEGSLYLVERGKWSYWGLYGLHSSILIILLGAILGTFLGYKGTILLPEGEVTDRVVERQTGDEIPLDFSVRLDSFFIDFYENGMPKEYRSDLTILNQGKEMLQKGVRVNDPLKYKGVTFYQSSYQSVPELFISLEDPKGAQKKVQFSVFEKFSVPDSNLQMIIRNFLPDVHGAPAAQVLIADERGVADAVWLIQGRKNEFSVKNERYKISLEKTKIKYITGLQVKKDPGVWIVWLGCTAMILGFVVVFWVPHRKTWLWLGKRDGKPLVLLSGQSNKNKIQFEKDFKKLEDAIEKALGEKK